jgi:hypothetical protein
MKQVYFLKSNLKDLESEIPGFVSFTFAGNEYTVLRSDRFYNQKVKGVTVVDWVNALIQGEKLKSLDCGDRLECENGF